MPGVQAAVYAGEGIAFSAAYGLADVENAVPLTEQHLFRIASHSKTFTATAVFQLVEQGRLRLDDKAAQHVTEIVGYAAGRADHPRAAGARRRYHPGQPGRPTGGSW